MAAAATQGQAERAELEAVLNSRIFNRAPSLANFLTYVCRCYFDGNVQDLKEYSIAVEALGRPPDFDQKKDSIVRVEAHRLRKRLADYYESAGSDHDIHIEIPSGQYAPHFIFKEHTGQAPAPKNVTGAPVLTTEHIDEVESLKALSPILLDRPSHRLPIWVFRAGLAAGLILTAAVLFWTVSKGTSKDIQEVWHGSTAEPVPGEFRMLAGYHGAPFTDRQGRTWQSDAYFTGGVSVALPTNLFFEALPDHGFARSLREGNFEYSVPERQGTY